MRIFEYGMNKLKETPYALEVALLPCSFSYIFAGGHTLLHLRRGLCQADTELLGRSPLQSIICVHIWTFLNSCTHTKRCDPAQTLTQFLQHWFHQPVSLFEPGKHELRPGRLHRVFLRLGDERHGAAASAGNQEYAISICGQHFPVINLRSAVAVWRPALHLHLQQTGQDV